MTWDKDKATKYKNNFIKNSYDRINLTVKKGQKESIQQHAENYGESLNGFINRAIIETIENDNQKQKEQK